MPRKKYNITPDMDAEIIRCYQERVGMSRFDKSAPVKKLAEKFGIPRHRVSRRACVLGVTPKMGHHYQPLWRKEELKILELNAHKVPEVIQRHLARAGFKRSAIAIVLKRQRLHLLQSLDGYSAEKLAECLGISASTARGYITKGYLRAKKRGTKRAGAQNGDQWWILEKDIRKFIIEHVGMLDFRKIDKYWLVSILTDNLKD